MPDITGNAKAKGRGQTPSDLEDKMEKILDPMAMASEAAFDALKLHAVEDQLSQALAEIVADAVNESFGTGYEELIALARQHDRRGGTG